MSDHLTINERVQWATSCRTCGDGPRLHPTEADARRVYQRDLLMEADVDVDRHDIRLLRLITVTTWADVSADATGQLTP